MTSAFTTDEIYINKTDQETSSSWTKTLIQGDVILQPIGKNSSSSQLQATSRREKILKEGLTRAR